MLIIEKVAIYLDRLESLVGEIARVRKELLLENKICEDNNYGLEEYVASDALIEKITTLYSFVLLKKELIHRITEFYNIYVLDPSLSKEEKKETSDILYGFSEEIKSDDYLLNFLTTLGEFKGTINVSICDNAGNVIETIELKGNSNA